ncbi:MAG TPA: hemerythrin domain-containing protein [Polyangiaceae bacterium]|nr:hemerythrin domain-containing protein [Polyangiaceae bacterium]
MTNALTMLKEDHKKVKALLEELAEAPDRESRKRQELLGQISLELVVHTTIEEEIFYPAFLGALKDKEDQKIYYEAQEEHKAAKVVLADLQKADPASPSFHGKAKVLKELVLHHAKEEESEMFDQARSIFEKEELEELGRKLEARKKELLMKQANGVTAGRPAGASI